MANRYEQIPLLIRHETDIKTTIRNHSTHKNGSANNNQAITSTGKDEVQLQFSCIAGGNADCTATWKTEADYKSSNYIPSNLSKKI